MRVQQRSQQRRSASGLSDKHHIGSHIGKGVRGLSANHQRLNVSNWIGAGMLHCRLGWSVKRLRVEHRMCQPYRLCRLFLLRNIRINIWTKHRSCKRLAQSLILLAVMASKRLNASVDGIARMQPESFSRHIRSTVRGNERIEASRIDRSCTDFR